MKKGIKLTLILMSCAALAAAFLLPDRLSDNADISDAPEKAPPDAIEMREAAYQKDIEALERLISSESADEDAPSDARDALERIVTEHQTELSLRALIEAAGYAPCLVVASGGGVTVTVDRERISREDAEIILSICIRHVDVPAESFRIMAGSLN